MPKLIRPDPRRVPGFELWVTPEGAASAPPATAGLTGFTNPVPTPPPGIPAAER